ncbi:hypothetical protein CPC08DRAFT_712247 [Agrocybe pediades]|nr:hypothetical protein CPC08DRAFT_712247 [Agrocybe pediades]
MAEDIPCAHMRASKLGPGQKRKHIFEAEQEAQLSPDVSQRMTCSMSAASIEAFKLVMSSGSMPPSGSSTPASSSLLSLATQSASAAKTRVRRPNNGLHWAKGGPASARPKTSQKTARRSSQVIHCGQTDLHIFDEDKIIFDITSPVARKTRCAI